MMVLHFVIGVVLTITPTIWRHLSGGEEGVFSLAIWQIKRFDKVHDLAFQRLITQHNYVIEPVLLIRNTLTIVTVVTIVAIVVAVAIPVVVAPLVGRIVRF